MQQDPYCPFYGPLRSGPRAEKGSFVEAVVAAVHAIVSLGLVFLILLHAGRGGGLSDMFGGGMSTGFSGSNVVERNLDRITVAASVLFAITTVLLVWLGR
jgi:preprotein translocase subunit SecG